MSNPRWRPLILSVVAVLAIWAIALTGYQIAKNSRMTAEKVRAWVENTDLRTLSGTARARAIADLAKKLNALSVEERRRARLERVGLDWFGQMTQEEKATFLEATMPTGFREMLGAFEQLSDEKRRRAFEDTMRKLRDSQARLREEGALSGAGLSNGPTTLNLELLAKVRAMGLKNFYSESSPQTKAELAPVLEELQRVMESGRPLREGRR